MKTFSSFLSAFLILLSSVTISAQNDDASEVFMMADEMPFFDGCETKACSDEKLIAFIQGNVKYPKKDRKKGIQGRVFVQFVIEKDGSTSSHQVVRGLSPSINKEAIRVIKKFPKWTPGRVNDHPVRVKYTLPFTFKFSK